MHSFFLSYSINRPLHHVLIVYLTEAALQLISDWGGEAVTIRLGGELLTEFGVVFADQEWRVVLLV